MERLLSPQEIERMAAEVGMPLAELFRRAGIAHTTFYRWRAGQTEPTLTVYRRIVNVLREASPA
jgi:predicted transcriptional regulator